MTVKEIWESKEKIAVHCNNAEEEKKLFAKLKELNCKWINKDSYNYELVCEQRKASIYYRNYTCFSNKGTWGSCEDFEDCKVIEFADLDDSKKEENKMKFKVGDKVRVKANLKDFNWNESPFIAESMLKYAGKDFIIESVGEKYYTLNKTVGISWIEKWLEPVETSRILDDVEFKYLLGVIKPFMNEVKGIEKMQHLSSKEYITIYVNVDETIDLPYFEAGKMYKGIKPNKLYTLYDLGFFKKKVGDTVCSDEICCENCPLGCTSCKHAYADPMPTLFEQLEVTLKDYPQLEPLREYFMKELNKEVKEEC